MYSNSLVGDPKNGVPSAFGHVRRDEDVARGQIRGPLFLRDQAGEMNASLQPGTLEIRCASSSSGPPPIISRRTESRYSGWSRQQAHERPRQHLGAVPGLKRGDEAEDGPTFEP